MSLFFYKLMMPYTLRRGKKMMTADLFLMAHLLKVESDCGSLFELKKPNYLEHTGSKQDNFWYKCRLGLTTYADLPEGHTFTPDSWREYVHRGLLFQEAPKYIVYPWCSLVKMERRARRAGWELILRFTSHSGVCPPHLDACWAQNTTWFWGLPGRQNIVIISYTEIKYTGDKEIRCYAETEWLLGNSGQDINIPKGFIYIGGSSSDRFLRINLGWRQSSNTLNPLRQCYTNEFWREIAAQECSAGPFQRLSLYNMPCSTILPGIQTNVQKILGIELQVDFMKLLHASKFHEWCRNVVGMCTLDVDVWNPVWCHYPSAGQERPALSAWHNLYMQGLLDVGCWAPIDLKHRSIFDYRELRVAPTARVLLDNVWEHVQGKLF
jgi:hypothetical protein